MVLKRTLISEPSALSRRACRLAPRRARRRFPASLYHPATHPHSPPPSRLASACSGRSTRAAAACCSAEQRAGWPCPAGPPLAEPFAPRQATASPSKSSSHPLRGAEPRMRHCRCSSSPPSGPSTAPPPQARFRRRRERLLLSSEQTNNDGLIHCASLRSPRREDERDYPRPARPRPRGGLRGAGQAQRLL